MSFYSRFTILLVALTCNTVMAQSVVKGIVHDVEDRSTVPFAFVASSDHSAFTICDLNGSFDIQLPAHINSLEISYLGYEQVAVSTSLVSNQPDVKFALSPVSRKSNLLWSSTERITLGQKAKIIKPKRFNLPKPKKALTHGPHNLKAYIYLTHKSGEWGSHAVLSTFYSQIGITDSPEIDCYNNIYFDIYEIFRRKLLQRLQGISPQSEEVVTIYNKVYEELIGKVEVFTKETDYGRNMQALSKWNEYVKEQISRDHLSHYMASVED